jgi:hypothetical protein
LGFVGTGRSREPGGAVPTPTGVSVAFGDAAAGVDDGVARVAATRPGALVRRGVAFGAGAAVFTADATTMSRV